MARRSVWVGARLRMRRAVVALFAFVFGATLSVLPHASAGAAPRQVDPAAARQQLVQQLQQAAGGGVTIATHARTGLVRFLSTAPSRPIPRAAGLSPLATPEAAARGFFGSYGTLFGISDPAAQLRTEVRPRSGTVRFQQVQKGVPVLGAELVVSVDSAGNVVEANGEALPRLTLSVTPTVGAVAATAAAFTQVTKLHRGSAGTPMSVSVPSLQISSPDILGGPGLATPRLVWQVLVSGDRPEPFRELVLVDAQSGTINLHFDELAEAKNRSVCDRNNVVGASATCSSPYVRVEGQAATGNSNVDLAYDYAGVTYDFYQSKFGRDSVDNAGLPLKSTVRYCDPSYACPFANAFWNGSQMVYGDGYATADDVVGHELTHGVTQYESHLFYYYQSGAIDESLSDVFGEIIDQGDGRGNDSAAVRWLIGEDLPIGALRNMADPTSDAGRADPDRMGSPNYYGDTADQGGVHENSGVNNKAAFLMSDGATFNGKTVTGIGTDKVARIYYKVQTDLLTSAGDYADLYNLLPFACASLVGTHGITTANCTQVKNAVDATQMNLNPAGASATEAPVCAAGQSPVNLFADNLENTASGNWTRTVTSGAQTWAYPQNPNYYSGFDATYATSGTKNFFGADAPSATDASIARTANVVPPNGKTTYLRFKHAYGLEAGYDGGRVEYSVNNGSTWVDAGSLFTDNGYDGTVASFGGGNGFTGESHGYYSSRLNLSTLHGQNVRFRFRLASDSSTAGYGWFIDDVTVYYCNRPPVANAGPDQSKAKNTAFTLNGAGSTDPDGDVLTYAWLQLSGTHATIQNPTSKSTSVSGVNADSRLVFRLTVTDSHGLTSTDTVQITVGSPK